MKFKRIMASLLASGIVLGSFSTSVFAAVTSIPGVEWKEKTGAGYQSFDEVYDDADGTFNADERTVVHTTSDSAQTYLFGTELPQKITEGTVVVDAEFKNPDSDNARLIRVFALSDENKGFSGTVYSRLVFGDGKKLTHENGYSSRWNDEVMPNSSAIKTSDGVYNLKLVVRAESETSDWEAKIYCKEKNALIPVYTYTITRAELPDIKCILNSNWLGKNKTAQLTVSKFLVRTFENDFTAEYEAESTDYEDRTVKINVSGTDEVESVGAYIVNEETEEKTLLDSANCSYADGVAEIFVPKDVYGIISIDLILETDAVPVIINVPLSGDPFEEMYVERPKSLELEEISEGNEGAVLKVNTDFREIVMKFNNNIEDSTVDAVTFTGSGVTSLQKTLSDDNKTLTISFDSLTDKETYTLSIGTSLTSKNGYNLQEEKTYIYQVDSDLGKLNIVNYNTESVYTLPPGAKKLELEFNFEPDTETLNDGIEFKRADNSKVPGGYTVEAGTDANKAVIKFGRLPMGEYKLSTNEMLKAMDPSVETRIAEWYFEVITNDDEALVFEDFSGLSEGTQDYIELAARIESGVVSYSNPGTLTNKYQIKKAQSGENYLQVIGTKDSKGGGLTINLPDPLTSGKIAVDVTIKAVGDAIKRNIFTLYSSGSQKVCTLQLNESNTISRNADSLTAKGTFTGIDYKTDDEGFYNLRILFVAADDESKWDILVYDRLTSLEEPIYTINAGRVYDSANKIYGVPNIKKISLFDLWYTDATDTDSGIAIKDFSLREIAIPAIIASNADDAQPDVEKIELFADSDLNDISDEAVKLKRADGEQIAAAEVSYNADERKLTIIPEKYLEYDTEYIVAFEKMICTSYGFKTAAAEIFVNSTPVLAEKNGVPVIEFSVQNNSQTLDAVYVIAKIFTNNGVKVKSGKFNVTTSGTLNEQLSLSDIELSTDDSVTVYILASDGTHIKAFMSSAVRND